jgi:parallel beta-helix repeat protein
LLARSDGNRFEANTANNNTHAGFHLGLSSNNTITGNTASHNEYGICYGTTDEGSPNNRIYHNNFVNNLQHVNILTTVNTWDDGYPSGGNYWSDYVGVDANGDGIGDTPYVIDENNVDRFPLMALAS